MARGKNNQSLIVLLLFIILVAGIALVWYLHRQKSSGTASSVNINPQPQITWELGKLLPQNGHCDQIVKHRYYTLCYNETREQADWVMYRLTEEMTYGTEERTDNFRQDKDVITGSARPEDYKKSGFDKGHLVPAGDMKWNEEAMSETFLMSNMSPQRKELNRGIWKELEEQVRDWARDYDELYVVAGPLYSNNSLEIGKGVDVPAYYFKVVVDASYPEYKSIAFLFRNEGSERPVYEFALSVDSLESISGFDFLPALPDKTETEIESKCDIFKWFSKDTWHASTP
ncbi:MAG: DNA/RNA non-specific endonuclease [Chitinophagales bacterium]|nr:DNA/RNA non-specific endonuclease [Chitinophagales bacterium]